MSQPDLAAVNSTTLGTHMPTVTLPDGSKIQTGTVGALIMNVKAYDQLFKEPPTDEAKIAQLEDNFKMAMPVLKKSGMMDMFPPEDWIRGSSPGRKKVGELYLEWQKAIQA